MQIDENLKWLRRITQTYRSLTAEQHRAGFHARHACSHARWPRDENESHRSYRMHDSKTRRWPPRSLQWRKYPPQTTLRRTTSLPVLPLDGHPPSRSSQRYTAPLVVVSPLPSPLSKSPLFIANGFRIMMPGWLRDPIQIPRVSSSGPTRFLPSPSLSLSLPLSPLLPSPRARGCYCRRRDCSRSRSFE